MKQLRYNFVLPCPIYVKTFPTTGFLDFVPNKNALSHQSNKTFFTKVIQLFSDYLSKQNSKAIEHSKKF